MYRSNVAPREQVDSSVGLPISWYFDPAILDIQRRELFAAGPRYVAHAGTVPADGGYAALHGQNHGWLLVQSKWAPASRVERLSASAGPDAQRLRASKTHCLSGP